MDVLDGEILAGLAVHAGSHRSERPLPQEIEHLVSIAQLDRVSADNACWRVLHYCCSEAPIDSRRLAFYEVQRSTNNTQRVEQLLRHEHNNLRSNLQGRTCSHESTSVKPSETSRRCQ